MKRRISILTVLIMLLLISGCSGRAVNLDKEINTAVEWVQEATPVAAVGSIGGEWAVKGIASSGAASEEHEAYFGMYFDNVRAEVKHKEGVLDDTYYTTYGRVIIAVTAIGEDPENVEGYNLVEPLDDAEKVLQQGVNAASYALIGSNLAGVQLENEEIYIDFILTTLEEDQLYADPEMSDYTAIAMEGLSFYREREDVKNMMDKCIVGLSQAQLPDGSLGNCESTAEVIIALTMVGVDPVNDQRFVKEGNSLLDGLLLYKGRDGYMHVTGENSGSQQMSTEKALLALDSIRLFQEGESLYERER